MLSKHDVVLHVNYIHYVFRVLVAQKLQNLQLYTRLVNLLPFVLYNF